MSDITETMTVKNGQAAVKTVTVAGKLSPKTSATDTIALVETSDGKQAALKVYNINGEGGGGTGGGDYLPLSGGTLSGPLTVNGILKSITFYPNNAFGDIGGTGDLRWFNVYTRALYNTGRLLLPEGSGTLARLEDIQNAGGGASLPDQTDNAGKFLMTDGTTVSWGNALANLSGNNSLWLGGGKLSGNITDAVVLYTGEGFVSAGVGAIAIGTGRASGFYSVCIGGFNCKGDNAIQLGGRFENNPDANTFKVGNANGNFEMMDANGNVPLGRLTYVTNQIGDISTALTAILGE